MLFFWLLKKLFGLIIILTALAGVAISVGCTIYGQQALDVAAAQTTTALDVVNVNLDTTTAILRVAQSTIREVNVTVDTVELTALNLAATIDSTEPLIDDISKIATQEVPASIETVQTTLPNIAEVAGTVDDTLTTLSTFGFQQSFFGLGELNFDLGIDYNPEVRFDQSITVLSTSLAGLPAQLRDLDTQLNVTQDNLGQISADIESLSANLDVVNNELAEIPNLLEGYIITIGDTQDQVRLTKGQILEQTENAKLAILIIAIWFGLVQLAPLAMGFQMLFARRPKPNTTDIINAEFFPES